MNMGNKLKKMYRCINCGLETDKPSVFNSTKIPLCPTCSGLVFYVRTVKANTFDFNIEDIAKNEDLIESFQNEAMFNRIMVTLMENDVTKEDIINIVKDLCDCNRSLMKEVADLRLRATNKLF